MMLPLTLALATPIPGLEGLGKILVFLMMLSILVVLHEGGHFLIARRNGVRVNDFAVGFGPTLLKWTSPRSGTNYRLNLLPVGGYCAMQGEDGRTNEAEQQRAFRATANPAQSDNFQSKTTWQRLAIVVAGPIANLILAYAIFAIGAFAFGVPTNGFTAQVGPVKPNSPAMRAGLRMGDEIVAIDGVRLGSGDAIVEKIRNSAGVPLQLTYSREGIESTVPVTPDKVNDSGKMVGQIGFQRTPIYKRVGPIDAFAVAGLEMRDQTVGQVGALVDLIAHPIQRGPQMSGVIGMERAASAYQDIGWGPYLQLAAAISIALGIFNLLPIPALDGGRALFILAEMLRGRPVDAEKEALVHVTGMAVLMVLMVSVAFHDIANIVSGKGVF
jgi:regulator of sigma E protease